MSTVDNIYMQPETNEFMGESLGELLHKTRKQKGFELSQIETDTKISLKNLRAMEEDAYGSLPADVFSRGFYALYADYLSLDPAEIVARYDREKMVTPVSDKTFSASNYSGDIGSMAARPSSLPMSTLWLLILILILFGGFLSWYFEWNPATYLSEKLRNFQNTSQHTEHPLKSPEKEFHALQNMLSITTVSNASEMAQEQEEARHKKGNYIINAQFKESTKVTLSIDNAPVHDYVYGKGDETTWVADEHINITLPGKTATQLSFNNTPIHLPKTSNATLTISLPSDVIN